MDGKRLSNSPNEKDMTNLTVDIAGRSITLKVDQQNAASIQSIVTELNESINRLQSSYPGKDKQHCLSMALLTYAVELKKTQDDLSSLTGGTGHNPAGLLSRLSHLEALLDTALA